jgi:3-isopropylmalate/(R)-2-methylmalate dehydratase small subunit
MTPFLVATGVAVPLLLDDINTDQIAPQQIDRSLNPDYRVMLFRRQRQDAGFILNRPQYQSAALLVGGSNFGCGSARETAVWALMSWGIRCVVARGFADIFRENCLQNGVLPLELAEPEHAAFAARVVAADGHAPFTVDLVARRISGPGGADIAFDLAPSDRTRLIEGLDDIGLTLKHADDIAAWERRTAAATPWLQMARDHRHRQ